MKSIAPIFMFLIAVQFISACGPSAQASSLSILPQDCSLEVSSQITLTLNGELDPDSQVNWHADLGSIVKNSQGLSATYIAPSVAGEAEVTASVTSGLSSSASALSVVCTILDPQATAPLTPVSRVESLGEHTVIISEVMGNTCGGLNLRKYNQYVELYNYGSQPMDVGGWWLYDEGESGTPDRLVAWNTRTPLKLDGSLVTDSTVIPPKGVAVILSPIYPKNNNVEKMPYRFPPGVVILTAAESETLGDDYFGIISDQDGYDTVTLYIGGEGIILSVVDTYGTPAINSAYPVDIDDDRLDHIPTYLSDCYSMERIDPFLPDSETNWADIYKGTPGEVPFQ